jgi:hypothetical protein
MNPACTQVYPSCDNPETCPEVFSAECVRYLGDDILDVDIRKGMSVTEIIQKLILRITNPGCSSLGSPCLSVIGFGSTEIGTSYVKLSWGAVTSSTYYVIQYKLPEDPVWTSLSQTSLTNGIVMGLSANTMYYFRVVSLCDDELSCNSLTLKITTKS